MIDLVFPNGNELKFIRIAERLGYNSLCFGYSFKRNLKAIKENISEAQKKTKVKLFYGLMSDIKNVSKVRKVCDLVLIKASGDDQAVFERVKPDIVYDLELNAKKDPINFRASGLNQVLCKFAAKNKVIIGFSFSSILNAKNRVMILGRMMQNIRFCRKYKVDTVFASFAKTPFEMRAWHDLVSFLIVLGMHAGKAKKSLKIIEEKIKENYKKKSSEYIGEGIEVIR
ncbi:hypothetical protein KY343_00635 [Candidatus Woesearchaeota archaeon]|nr:hypothetical protein [Candidatus Woesearchaeota archaeon]